MVWFGVSVPDSPRLSFRYIPRGVVTPRAPPSTVGDGVVGAGTRAPAKLTPVLSGEAVEQMTIWPVRSLSLSLPRSPTAPSSG